MTLIYLWAKMCRKIRGSAISNSRIHKSAKVEAGGNIVNTTIGRYSFCGYDCTIIDCDIGAFCSIAGNVMIGGARHTMEWVSTSPVFASGRDSVKAKFSTHTIGSNLRTIIGNDVWIGENAKIKAGVHIADGSVIGMGSVVTKDVPAYAIAVGCPARIVRNRFDDVTIRRLLEIKWWEFDDLRLARVANFVTNPEEFIREVGRQ